MLIDRLWFVVCRCLLSSYVVVVACCVVLVGACYLLSLSQVNYSCSVCVILVLMFVVLDVVELRCVSRFHVFDRFCYMCCLCCVVVLCCVSFGGCILLVIGCCCVWLLFVVDVHV